MTTILIVDAVKSSIVMTSEIIKDHLPGSSILIAANGQEAVEIASQKALNLMIIDIDLPDTDAITLTKYFRQFYRFPILITTFPEQVIIAAINLELFAYQDATDWLKKPVNSQEMAAKLDRYVTKKSRIEKQFETTIAASLSAHNSNSKKNQNTKGNIITLSIYSALVELEDKVDFDLGDEVTVSLLTPLQQKTSAKLNGATKVTAKITWTNKNKNQAEIEFAKLSNKSLKIIEAILRKSATIG